MKITDILDIADKRPKIGNYTVYPIVQEEVDYLTVAPEMESKLRSIVDMLPEIKQAVIDSAEANIALHKQGCNRLGEVEAQENMSLLAKLEKWENE